jgi:hypothetical protein
MKEHDELPSARRQRARGLGRRDFLAGGALLAASPWLEGLAWGLRPREQGPGGEVAEGAGAAAPPLAAEGAAAATPIVQGPVSVGYLDGSAEIRNLRRVAANLEFFTVRREGNTLKEGRTVVPAAELSAGDPTLVNGPLRMTVRGFYPTTLARLGTMPRAVDLDVYFPSLDLPNGGGYLFEAWSYRRNKSAEDRSAGLSFLLWPDWHSPLSVRLRVVPARPGPVHIHQTAFTLGADPGRPRLLRGAYLLALNPGAWDSARDLPATAREVPPELLSILVTFQPEGVHRRG